MRKITVEPCSKVIELGRYGENEATAVYLPLAEFQNYTPGGTFFVLVRRPDVTEPSPVSFTVEGGYAIWVVGEDQLAVEGYGEVELRYVIGETRALSRVWSTHIGKSLLPVGDTPPDPFESWYENIITAGDRAEGFATAAEESAEDAAESATAARASEDNAKAAETAAGGYANSAEVAKNTAVGAKDTALAAAQRAESAEGNAEAAKSTAQTAAGVAESAKIEAVSAKNTAVNASGAAQSYATSAENAKNTAVSASQTATAKSGEAASSAADASISAQAATLSAQNATASATAAATSETNAAVSERQAGLSKDAATVSAQNAGQSAAAASASATNAAESELAAQGYAEEAEETVAEAKTRVTTIILPVSGWVNNRQTATVANILADETKQVIEPIPANASVAEYISAGVIGSAQVANGVVFECVRTPTTDLTVYIAVREVTNNA